MAYVVPRPRGAWEIRESYTSPAGPRARTLATFRVLSPDVIRRASSAARTPIDADRLLRAARRAGAPIERSPADGAAADLIHHLERGEFLRPGLRRLLLDRLNGTLDRSGDEAIAPWVGASIDERGKALLDLLGLADRLPQRRRGSLRYPGLSPERSRR